MLDDVLNEWLAAPPYDYASPDHVPQLLALLRAEIERAAAAHAGYGRLVTQWPVPLPAAERIADLPYLHVSAFKQDPPLILVPRDQIKRVIRSSATSGQEPSQIGLDTVTARRMTRGVVTIFRDFIGSDRRPYLIIDHRGTTANQEGLSARAAAILGLQSFASDTSYGLRVGDSGRPELDLDALATFSDVHAGAATIAYGFTTVLWQDFVLPAEALGLRLQLPHVRVFHSGGWKRLIEQSVSKEEFNRRLAAILGCDPTHIVDFYGMAENVGVIYPDCAGGHKHAPSFGGIVVRDPLTLAPVPVGETGLVQLVSLLPASFPGHSLLTDDLATVMHDGDCPCGRSGIAFRFAGRVPKADVRGCGNLQPQRFPGRAA